MLFDLELKFLTNKIIVKMILCTSDGTENWMTDWVRYRKIDGLYLKKKKWNKTK